MESTKQYRHVEVKSLNEDGTFEGVLSPYNNVDQGDDMVMPGAFTKTLQERGNEVPLLWQHDEATPIGKLTLSDEEDGLHAKGQLCLDVPEGMKAYKLMKAGIVKGLSIGYKAVKSTMVSGVRQLKEIRLYEGSCVTFPMNELATISSVKAAGETKGFAEELAENQLLQAGDQILGALYSSLSDITWSDLSDNDKSVALKDTIDQFKDAYMNHMKDYLPWLSSKFDAAGMKSKRQELATKHGITTKSSGAVEIKAGRKISAATRETLASVHDHMTEAKSLLSSLLDDEADETVSDSETEELDSVTSSEKAAVAVEQKSEPLSEHSAAESLISEIRTLLQTA